MKRFAKKLVRSGEFLGELSDMVEEAISSSSDNNEEETINDNETQAEQGVAEDQNIALAKAFAEVERLNGEIESLHVQLAEKTAEGERLRAAINARNAEQSAGAVTNTTDSGYFSPTEVRKMSPDEVKKNYSMIIESMKKWN